MYVDFRLSFRYKIVFVFRLNSQIDFILKKYMFDEWIFLGFSTFFFWDKKKQTKYDVWLSRAAYHRVVCCRHFLAVFTKIPSKSFIVEGEANISYKIWFSLLWERAIIFRADWFRNIDWYFESLVSWQTSTEPQKPDTTKKFAFSASQRSAKNEFFGVVCFAVFS